MTLELLNNAIRHLPQAVERQDWVIVSAWAQEIAFQARILALNAKASPEGICEPNQAGSVPAMTPDKAIEPVVQEIKEKCLTK